MPEVQVYQAVWACPQIAPMQHGLFAIRVNMSLLSSSQWCQRGLLCSWNSFKLFQLPSVWRVYFFILFQINDLLFLWSWLFFFFICWLGCKRWFDSIQLYRRNACTCSKHCNNRVRFPTNFIWFCLLLFCVRRLGIELGKSVVYQEPNRGETVIHWLINICVWFLDLFFDTAVCYLFIFFLMKKQNNKNPQPSLISDVDCFRDESGCGRICPWTRHLHHPDHPKVSTGGRIITQGVPKDLTLF